MKRILAAIALAIASIGVLLGAHIIKQNSSMSNRVTGWIDETGWFNKLRDRMEDSRIQAIIRTLGSLASMISASIAAYKFFAGKDNDVIPDELRKAIRDASENPILPAKPDVVVTSLRQIPDEFLRAFHDRLDQLKKEYLRIVQTPGTTILEIKQVDDMISLSVCDLLRLIMRHNNDELPKDDRFYGQLWGTFGCEHRASIIT